jgi:hypothetical protein
MSSDIQITKEYKQDDGSVYGLAVVVDNAYEIGIKWDGCINLRRVDDPETYIHICDINVFAKMLLEVEQFRRDNIEGTE